MQNLLSHYLLLPSMTFLVLKKKLNFDLDITKNNKKMAAKKGTKSTSIYPGIANSITEGARYFGQFAISQLINDPDFGISIGDQKTYLSDKTFTTEAKKAYDLTSPKFNAFIKMYVEASKPDFDVNKFESKYAKLLQNVVNKQHNRALFELYKTSNNEIIRSIKTHIEETAGRIFTDSSAEKALYVQFTELLYVGFSILVHRSSFVSGSTLKDEQSFRRLFAGEFTEGAFNFGGEDDRDFLRTIMNLVTKAFEQKPGTKKTGAKKEDNVVPDKTSNDDDIESMLGNAL